MAAEFSLPAADGAPAHTPGGRSHGHGDPLAPPSSHWRPFEWSAAQRLAGGGLVIALIWAATLWTIG